MFQRIIHKVHLLTRATRFRAARFRVYERKKKNVRFLLKTRNTLAPGTIFLELPVNHCESSRTAANGSTTIVHVTMLCGAWKGAFFKQRGARARGGIPAVASASANGATLFALFSAAPRCHHDNRADNSSVKRDWLFER